MGFRLYLEPCEVWAESLPVGGLLARIHPTRFRTLNRRTAVYLDHFISGCNNQNAQPKVQEFPILAVAALDNSTICHWRARI